MIRTVIYLLTILTFSMLHLQLNASQMPDGHEHLEPIIENYSQYPEYSFFLPEIQSVLIEHSDFLKRLYERETADDFLPYITEYEELKGSPINPNVRIFFYDGSRFIDDYYYYESFVNGKCFVPFNLTFINSTLWTNHIANKLQDMLSVFDRTAEEFKRATQLDVSQDAIDFVLDEERNRIEEAIRGEEQRDASLSEEERWSQDHFLRKLLLFHELGHCDLQRGDEETADSIMNTAFLNDIIERVRHQYPGITLDSFLSPLLINELFLFRNTVYRPLGFFDSLIARFGYGPASDESRTEVILNIQGDITALRYYAMIANLVDE